MELGHLLSRSGLTCPEISSKVCTMFKLRKISGCFRGVREVLFLKVIVLLYTEVSINCVQNYRTISLLNNFLKV